MYYSRIANRANPRSLFILCDKSTSTLDALGTAFHNCYTIAEGIAWCVNSILAELVHVSQQPDGVKDYYHVALLGYSDGVVESAFEHTLKGRTIVPISEIADNPVTMDGTSPVWLEAGAFGDTPMRVAMEHTRTLVSDWMADYPDAPAPVILHATDGESTDGDPVPAAQQLQQLDTGDGPPILFNINISAESAEPLMFPSSPDQMPNDYGRMLFDMSSEVPPFIRDAAREEGIVVNDGARCLVFNADIAKLMLALKVGTAFASADR